MMTSEISTGRGGSRVPWIVSLLLFAGMTQDVQYGILNPLVGSMAIESGLSGSEIAWVLNAMGLGSLISVGLTAKMGDIFGHRRVLIVLAIIALVGSMVAALGSGFGFFVIGRFLMGFGVALPLCFGLLRPRATTKSLRGASLALGLVMSAFFPIALILGGLVVLLGLPWQSSFWVITFLFLVILIVGFVVPESPRSVRTSRRLDVFGALGLGVWATALLVGFTEGPGRGWTSPLVVCAFMVFVVVLGVWIAQQRRAAEPIMSFRNMDKRQALVGYSATLAVATVGLGVFLVTPTMLQTPVESGYGLGLTPIESSFVLLGLLPGGYISYLWNRWALPRFGPRVVLVAAALSGALVFFGLAFFHGELWMAYLWTTLYGATVLSFMNAAAALISAAGRQDNMGVTIAMQNIVNALGAAPPLAIVLNVMAPSGSAFIPEETFTGLYIAFAVVLVGFAGAWLVCAPRQLRDFHAIDSAPIGEFATR